MSLQWRLPAATKLLAEWGNQSKGPPTFPPTLDVTSDCGDYVHQLSWLLENEFY